MTAVNPARSTTIQRTIIVAATIAVGLYLLIAALTTRPWTVPFAEPALPDRQTGQPVQALYQAENAARRLGWTPQMQWLAGDLYAELGRPDLALPLWRAASQAISDPTLFRDLARASYEQGDLLAAYDTWTAVHGAIPNDPEAAFQRAIMAVALDLPDTDDALGRAAVFPEHAELADLLRMARQVDGDPIRSQVRVGLIFVERNLWPLARATFERLSALENPPALALAYYGVAIDQTGGDGSAWVQRAVQQSPQDPQVRLLEGLHYRFLRDDSASLQALRTAVALDPTRPALLAELGTGYRLAGDLENARLWLERAAAMAGGAEPFAALLQSVLSEQEQVLNALGILPESTESPAAPGAESTQSPAG